MNSERFRDQRKIQSERLLQPRVLELGFQEHDEHGLS